MEPYELTVAGAAAGIRAGRVSPVELTESVLARIERVDPLVRAYRLVDRDGARAAARLAEREIAATGPRGPLHGIPVSLKDLFDVAGHPTRAGSAAYDGHRAAADSAVAARLRAAGAVITGKTHTHELAKGVTTPPTRNPWDLGRTPGGSSGGSAAAVAAQMGPASIGTDTGGSVRIPAAACGLVGLKPTYGLIDAAGLHPLSWSFDHPGPLTRTVTDAALLLDALTAPAPDAPGLDTGVAGLVIGVPADFFFDGCDPAVERPVRAAIATLEELGARLRTVAAPMPDVVVALSRTIIAAEGAAAERGTLRDRGARYGGAARASVESGLLIPATDYLQALRVRELYRRAWRDLFATVDLVAAPTLPTAPPPYGTDTVPRADGSTIPALTAFSAYNYPANAAGLPSLQIPVGTDAAGLPVGMQLIGRPYAERTVLRAGRAYESVSPQAGRVPAL
ncbi:MAG TPA: amidase [Streptosporangiaceae bacterium]|jgi:aspartyl-tRNA(Asn)/glutamyl-tRNA(Gln) amidotransferase subunit A